MHTQLGTQVSTTGRRGSRRWATRVVGVAAVVTACLGVAPGIASAQPVNPSDAQLSAAQKAQQDAAAQVGQITAALAQAQTAAANASAAANIALQDYQEKQAASDEARAAAAAAAAAAAKADADLHVGKDQVAKFARDSYMQGSTSSGALSLMTAGGPAEMLERAALLDAVGAQRVDVVAQLTVLEEQATVADQAARQSVVQADTLQGEAATLLASAQEQEVAARGQTAALTTQQAQYATQLAQAQQSLTGLEAQRSAAAAASAVQPAAAAQRPATSSTSSGSPGSSSNASAGPQNTPAATPPAPVTTAGTPSGSAVQTAINAAMSQLGVPYSWGGGGSAGPGFGMWPDGDVRGFDCSSLVQYAYGQAGIQTGRTTRDQAYRFRNQSVARDDLQAGDLVFWATGSSYDSTYHVALYLGGGKIIQAPQSGDVVKISSMWFGSDYYGAVRPTG